MQGNGTRTRALGVVATTAVVALAVGRAQDPGTPPAGRAGQYEPGQLGTITQPLPEAPPPGSEYGVGPYPLYTPELAAGEGRDLVAGACGGCHSTVYITMQPPLPRAAWDATVHKMIRAFGAPIAEDVAGRIVDYLAAHYSPGTRAH